MQDMLGAFGDYFSSLPHLAGWVTLAWLAYLVPLCAWLAFVFFVVQRVGFALGQNGIVPAWLGAWLPNLAFALTGLVLTARVR